MSQNDSIPNKRPVGLSARWFSIGWVLVGGVALRLLWIMLCPNSPTSDQGIYHETAAMMAGGHGYVHPDGSPGGWWPVGYSALLSVAYKLFGIEYTVAYLLNCALGAASILGCYLLGRDLFSRSAGLWAAVGFAVHPTFILLTTIHSSETAAIAGSLWFLWLCVILLKRDPGTPWPGRQWLGYVAAGVLLGATVYVRAPVLLLGAATMMLGWLWQRPLRQWLTGTAVIGLVSILTILPWGFRNQAVFGSFQPLSMNGGSNLWMGNHEGSDGSYAPLPDSVSGMELTERETHLREIAVEFIFSDPAGYLGLCLRRTMNTLKGDTVGVVWNSNGITARFGEGMIVPLKLLCTAVHYLILIGFLVSLVAGLWRRDLRREKVFLGGVILLMAVPFVLIVGGNRYHLCMMPFLIVWGGETVARLLRERHPA